MAMSAVATIRTLQNDSNRRVAILNEIHFSSLHLFQGTHPGNPESSVSLGIKSFHVKKSFENFTSQRSEKK